MKIAVVACAALALPGCALFSGSSRTAEAARPLEYSAPARTVREPFRPAFAVGQPVALVPCKGSARLSYDCRKLGAWHEVSGGMPEIESPKTLREASAEAED